MTASPNSVVVWEWMNEFGRWRPYDPHISNFIEQNTQTSPSVQVNLGRVEPSLGMYSIDFPTMCQIRFGTGTARPVRRQLYPESSPPGKGIIWQWEGDAKGEWHTFDMEVACIIEDHFSNTASQNTPLDLSKSAVKLPYILDFKNMTQTRIETGRKRTIKRELLTVPYMNFSSQNLKSGALSNNSAGSDGLTSTSQINGSMPSSAKKPRRHGTTQIQHSNSSNVLHVVNSQPNFLTAQAVVMNSQIPAQTTSSTSSVKQGPITRKRLHSYRSGAINVPTQNLGQTPVQNPVHTPIQSQGANMASNSMPMTSFQSGIQAPNVQVPLTNVFPAGSMNFLQHNALNHSSLGFGLHPGMNIGTSVHGNQSHPGNHGLVGGSGQQQGMIGGGGMPPYQNTAFRSVGSRRISPVVSGVTNVLMSPAAPLLVSPPSSASSSSANQYNLPHEDTISNNAPKHNKKQASGKSSVSDVFDKYVTVINIPPKDEDCCICCECLTHPSGYGEGQQDDKIVYKLSKCSHMFHKLCILAMYESSAKNGSVQCPTCKTIYGEKQGNCPHGNMEYHRLPHPLPGNEKHQTIRIMYHISPGIQGPEHPHPGKRYTSRGFPRVCYLPDSDKGRKVLKLLTVAWKRRLTFTIGQSTTTGEADTVTWNEIHHKTEFGTNYTGHGYPDDNYLDNVLMELAVHGVTEADLTS